MRRLLPLIGVLALVGCGSASTIARHVPTRAGELHQPGAPVLTAPVHAAPVPASAGAEGRSDGRVTAGGASCGRERWSVKTATDAAAGSIKLTPINTTVAALGALPTTNPGNPDQPRDSGVESTVYRITAVLTGAKREADSDFHLVLQEPGGGTMIAEIPDAPACTVPPVTAGVSVLEEQIEHSRADFIREFGEPGDRFTTIEHQVTVTGVGFFDVPHGQTGVAPNAIELHPVLTIADP